LSEAIFLRKFYVDSVTHFLGMRPNCEANDALLGEIAKQTNGFSGAALANIVEQAIILAEEKGDPIDLSPADFAGAIADIKTELASSPQAQEPVPQVTANNPMVSQVANQFLVSLLQFLSQYQNPEVGNSSMRVDS
jgi:SpoVK/Ycf46/Vps4 family AAA+-type ATPase